MFLLLLVFADLETAMTDDELGGCSKRTRVQERVISSRKIANLISTCCNGPIGLVAPGQLKHHHLEANLGGKVALLNQIKSSENR